MRFMILRKTDSNIEAGALPGRELLASIARYNETLRAAGVLIDGEWLQPSSKASRISAGGGKITVTDGPFTELKELIAGFTLIEVDSKEEAVAWASRCPTLCSGGIDAEIEVRQVFEASDFPADCTPELTCHASTKISQDAKDRLRSQNAPGS